VRQRFIQRHRSWRQLLVPARRGSSGCSSHSLEVRRQDPGAHWSAVADPNRRWHPCSFALPVNRFAQGATPAARRNLAAAANLPFQRQRRSLPLALLSPALHQSALLGPRCRFSRRQQARGARSRSPATSRTAGRRPCTPTCPIDFGEARRSRSHAAAKPVSRAPPSPLALLALPQAETARSTGGQGPGPGPQGIGLSARPPPNRSSANGSSPRPPAAANQPRAVGVAPFAMIRGPGS